jgi:hypothetical protein
MAALVGVAYGESGKTGEYITGLAELEGRERERLWRFLKDYRQAGYEESRLELAERQIDMLQAAQWWACCRTSGWTRGPDGAGRGAQADPGTGGMSGYARRRYACVIASHYERAYFTDNREVL